jgi:hypothetical protein
MDEILISNLMVFSDLVEDEPYDPIVDDEARDIDIFWHENPELKNTTYAWMADFVGWLPMPDAGGRERELTTTTTRNDRAPSTAQARLGACW